MALIVPPARAAETPAYNPFVAAASGEGESAIKGFRPAPGLKVDLFAAEPYLANPVAFCVDNSGRFYVAETFRHSPVGPAYRLYEGVLDIRSHLDWLDDDLAAWTVADRVALLKKHLGPQVKKLAHESERIRLVEDRDGDGKADHATVYAEGFNQIPDGIGAGLLAREGKVYFSCIPNLWQLRDTNGDGRADVRKVLHTGYGVHIAFVGHDLHGLRFGPDGRLYFSIGDRGLHVTTWERLTLSYPDEGVVLRCEPDGTGLEVFARGLRNPQELAFDQYGNLFTGDNNSDGGDRARWVYVVEGGDSGWRIGYQHLHDPPRRGPWNGERLWHPQWDGQAAYIVPPLANLGYGPSGLAYYPGTGLPARYDGHFLLCDFRGGGSSGIHCFALKPKGAAYELTDYSQFIWDTLPTDVDFGVDGGAYFTDWVEGWNKTGKGRIYRVHDPAVDQESVVLETRQLLAAGMKQRPGAELAGLLGHRDMRVRQEAQFALAARGEAKLLAQAAQTAPDLLARLHGIWGLGQIGRKNPRALSPILSLLADREPEVRAQTARVMGDARVWKSNKGLTALLSDPEPRVRFFAAISAGKTGGAGPALVKLLRDNQDKDAYLRHAAVMGLLRSTDLKQLLREAKDPSPSVRRGVLLVLRRVHHPEIARFLADQEASLVLEAARAISDVPITAAMSQLAALIDRPGLLELLPATMPVETNAPSGGGREVESALSDVRTATGSTPPLEQLLQRIINANVRQGEAENARALARFVAQGRAPEASRFLAMTALGAWSKPSARDLVTGLWRPLPERNAAHAWGALLPLLVRIMWEDGNSVHLAALDAIEKLKMPLVRPLLLRLAEDQNTAGELRARALRVLASFKEPSLAELLERASTDDNELVRKEASRLQADVDPAAAMKHLLTALEQGSVTEKQGALATLAGLKAPGVEAVLARWMQQLQAGQVEKELQLDIILAATQRSDPALLQQVKQFDQTRPKTQLAPFQTALYGGNAIAGRKIFTERLELSCIKCHKIGNDGSAVGPDLTHIGAQKTREYLAESILFPNNQIAAGHENVLVTLNNETGYSGKLVRETTDEIVVDSPEDGLVTVAKKNIKSRARGLSAMPEEFRQILPKQDLRDLVEYLGSLK